MGAATNSDAEITRVLLLSIAGHLRYFSDQPVAEIVPMRRANSKRVHSERSSGSRRGRTAPCRSLGDHAVERDRQEQDQLSQRDLAAARARRVTIRHGGRSCANSFKER
jgi:hypothetical protein